MDPQLLLPSPAAEFNFDSTSTTPYTTAPSSPNTLFPKFFSSKHSVSPLNHDDGDDDIEPTSPFGSDDGMDFAFEFSGQLDTKTSVSDADELFDGGRIKPLEPVSDLSSMSYNGRIRLVKPENQTLTRSPLILESTARHKVSPLRISDVIGADDEKKVSTSTESTLFGFTWYNKWNLKNLLLFRSTSEGSAATSDDSLKKYTMITKGDQDVKNSSFRSCEGGSVGGSSKRMKRKMSAHEMHYTANRAVAEEMRRKTFLPYKSGLLGCLGFSQDLRDVSRRR